jgi:hypothetical protein
MLLLPDGDTGLQLVDDVASGAKCVSSMSRADGNCDADLTDIERPDPVDYCDPFQIPAVSSLSDDLGDLSLNNIVVGLVLETSDTLLAVGVVTDSSEEERYGSTAGIADELEQPTGLDRLRADRDQIIFPSGLVC